MFRRTHQLQQSKHQEQLQSLPEYKLHRYNDAASAGVNTGAAQDFLRTLLRRYPYWYRGHLLLAEALYNEKQYVESYICALTIGEKFPKESLRLKSILLLCLGAPGESLVAFEKLYPEVQQGGIPSTQADLEHYFGILLALDKIDAINAITSRLTEAQRTAPIRTVEEYIKTQRALH